jgi:hypothetical protein
MVVQHARLEVKDGAKRLVGAEVAHEVIPVSATVVQIEQSQDRILRWAFAFCHVGQTCFGRVVDRIPIVSMAAGRLHRRRELRETVRRVDIMLRFHRKFIGMGAGLAVLGRNTDG